MKIVDPIEFIANTGDPFSNAPGELDLSEYFGIRYACACGRAHILTDSTPLIREMTTPKIRIVVACPDRGGKALTLLQLRDGLARRAFAEMGCRYERVDQRPEAGPRASSERRTPASRGEHPTAG